MGSSVNSVSNFSVRNLSKSKYLQLNLRLSKMLFLGLTVFELWIFLKISDKSWIHCFPEKEVSITFHLGII